MLNPTEPFNRLIWAYFGVIKPCKKCNKYKQFPHISKVLGYSTDMNKKEKNNMNRKWYEVHTQYRENYAYHDWDGKGKCPQGWKNKGGTTFHIYAENSEEAETKWRKLRDAQGFTNDDFSTETVIGVELGQGCPYEKTKNEIECTADDGYCWDEANREMLDMEEECCDCEHEWRKDEYTKLIEWQGYTICTDCQESASTALIQAQWEYNNRHIWDSQH